MGRSGRDTSMTDVTDVTRAKPQPLLHGAVQHNVLGAPMAGSYQRVTSVTSVICPVDVVLNRLISAFNIRIGLMLIKLEPFYLVRIICVVGNVYIT